MNYDNHSYSATFSGSTIKTAIICFALIIISFFAMLYKCKVFEDGPCKDSFQETWNGNVSVKCPTGAKIEYVTKPTYFADGFICRCESQTK